jgi:polyferredoxin
LNGSKLPLLRRISQVAFLLLFLALLVFTSLRATPGTTSDIHLRAPVRLFFELDPLVAVANALATRALYRGLLWSLVILLPTLFLGRFFCGWICPLGTLQQFVGKMPSATKRGKQRIESNRYKRWQTLKYVVLIAGLLAAFFGTMAIGWLDPFSLMVRSVGLGVLPALNYAVRAALAPLEHSHVAVVQTIGQDVHAVLNATVLDFRQAYFTQAFFLSVLFVLILAASLRVTRLWCRSICPLGALLGAISRWSILGLHKSASCNRCNRCLLHCQGGDDPIGGALWRKSECLMCMNCIGSCPDHSLEFRFFRKEREIASPDLSRRRTVTGLAAGAVIVPLMRVDTTLGKDRHERLLRPPGALDESDFLSRCVRCGECMKVCPNNALQPTLGLAGLEGLWTPTLVPRIGYCEPSCVLCSEVCPTGAIWQITANEKGWVADTARFATPAGTSVKQPIRLGTAFYDRGHCLPWAMATECIVCEEWCPVSPKAIYLQEEQVVDAEGKLKILKQPHIDPSRCVGCGACEYACPIQDHPAVYVTSIGESRSPSSQALLSRK